MGTPHPTFPAVGAAGGGVAATGDPHLQNVHGERFDLMKPGKHALINIPRGDLVENALFRVEAEASRMGGQCADMYFQEINNTGQGTQYLNFYVKHLGHAGFAVGGLLGEDDHKDVMIPPASCAHRTSLASVSSLAMAM